VARAEQHLVTHLAHLPRCLEPQPLVRSADQHHTRLVHRALLLALFLRAASPMQDRLKLLRILFRQLAPLHVPINHKMNRLPFAQQQLVARAHDSILEPHNRPAHTRQRRPHNQLIVVSRRSLVPRCRLHHCDHRVFFLLHRLIVQAHLSYVLHPAYLKPHQVVRVVHHTHLIGLRIPHTHSCLCRRHLFTTSPRTSSTSFACFPFTFRWANTAGS